MFWVYDSDTFYARTKRGQQLVRKREDLLARVHAARWDKLAKYLYLGNRGQEPALAHAFALRIRDSGLN